MESFNRKLEVGCKAIVIGTFFAENSHVIGTVVTVEQIIGDDGTVPDNKYLSESGMKLLDEFGGWGFFEHKNSAVVSGIKLINEYYIDNHQMFDQKHLMPIGNDDTLIEMFKEETNPYLETV